MLVELSKMEQRYDAVMAVIRDGLTVTEVAATFGVSRQSIYRGWRATRQGGSRRSPTGRIDRTTLPHQMAGALEAAVLEMRRLHPSWGPMRLLRTSCAERAIEPALAHGDLSGPRAHGLIEPKTRKRKRLRHLQALGTGPADGAVADGHRRRGPLRRRHRVQDA